MNSNWIRTLIPVYHHASESVVRWSNLRLNLSGF